MGSDPNWNPCLVGGFAPDKVDDWPNCTIADCEHKQCTWTGTLLCHPHAVELLGRDEVDRRYDQTHEFTRAEMDERRGNS